ncbi:MAG TPA: hypothetical protein VEH30_07645 [Terriglobales bacterium]|nr:hypothetical protein [Terriglobales bacterium]
MSLFMQEYDSKIQLPLSERCPVKLLWPGAIVPHLTITAPGRQ